MKRRMIWILLAGVLVGLTLSGLYKHFVTDRIMDRGGMENPDVAFPLDGDRTYVDNAVLWSVLAGTGVTKRFGGLVAVNKVDIELRRNEILGLIGPNGAGKTTLFNMLSGTMPMTEGTLHYHGKQVPHPKANEMCKMGIGRTYQICQPFSNLTVLENVMVGAPAGERAPWGAQWQSVPRHRNTPHGSRSRCRSARPLRPPEWSRRSARDRQDPEDLSFAA